MFRQSIKTVLFILFSIVGLSASVTPDSEQFLSQTNVVLVLGTHHTATSLLSHALINMGMYAGEADDLMLTNRNKPLEDNTKFFEQAQIVELDDLIFEASRRDIDIQLPTWLGSDVNLNTLEPYQISGFISKARKVAEYFASSGNNLVLKDPRMSLLLPIWMKALSQAKSVNCIITYRDPHQTLASLSKFVSPHESSLFFDIWTRSYEESLSYCAKYADVMIVVSQESLSLSMVETLETVRLKLMSAGVGKSVHPSISSGSDDDDGLKSVDARFLSVVSNSKKSSDYQVNKMILPVNLLQTMSKLKSSSSSLSLLLSTFAIKFHIMMSCHSSSSSSCQLNSLLVRSIDSIYHHYPHAHIHLYVKHHHQQHDDDDMVAGWVNLGYRITIINYEELTSSLSSSSSCLSHEPFGSIYWKLAIIEKFTGIVLDLGSVLTSPLPLLSSYSTSLFSMVGTSSYFGSAVGIIGLFSSNAIEVEDTEVEGEDSPLNEVRRRMSAVLHDYCADDADDDELMSRIMSIPLFSLSSVEVYHHVDLLQLLNNKNKMMMTMSDYYEEGYEFKDDTNRVVFHVFPDLFVGSSMTSVSVGNILSATNSFCIICLPVSSQSSSLVLSRDYDINFHSFYYIWTTISNSFQPWRLRFIETIFRHANDNNNNNDESTMVHLYSNSLTHQHLPQFNSHQVTIHPIDLETIFDKSPMSRLVPNMGEYNKGSLFYSHLTDGLRILLLYKYGGTYLDSDVAILDDLSRFGSFAGNQGPPTYITNGAVLRFPKYHPFLILAMQEYVRRYRIPCTQQAFEKYGKRCYKNNWTLVGPALLTDMLEIVPKELVKKMDDGDWLDYKKNYNTRSSRDNGARLNDLNGFIIRIFPPVALYPIPWTQATKNELTLVSREEYQDFSVINNSVSFHMWNKLNALNTVTPFSFMHYLLAKNSYFPLSEHYKSMNKWLEMSAKLTSIVYIMSKEFDVNGFSSSSLTDLSLLSSMVELTLHSRNFAPGTPIVIMIFDSSQDVAGPQRIKASRLFSNIYNDNEDEQLVVNDFIDWMDADVKSSVVSFHVAVNEYDDAIAMSSGKSWFGITDYEAGDDEKDGATTTTRRRRRRRLDNNNNSTHNHHHHRVLPSSSSSINIKSRVTIIKSRSLDMISLLKQAIDYGISSEYTLFLANAFGATDFKVTTRDRAMMTIVGLLSRFISHESTTTITTAAGVTRFKSPFDLPALVSMMDDDKEIDVMAPAVTFSRLDVPSKLYSVRPDLRTFEHFDLTPTMPQVACSCIYRHAQTDGIVGCDYAYSHGYLMRSSLLERVGNSKLFSLVVPKSTGMPGSNFNAVNMWREDIFRLFHAVRAISVYVNAISLHSTVHINSAVPNIQQLPLARQYWLRHKVCKSCNNPQLKSQLHAVVLYPPVEVISGSGIGKSSSSSMPFVEMSIVAFVRSDDVIFLPEWIEFHMLQGFSRFVLYDEQSSDDLSTILTTYIDDDVVWLLPSSVCSSSSIQGSSIKIPSRSECINHALSNFGKNTNWMAFIDPNEFMTPYAATVNQPINADSPDRTITSTARRKKVQTTTMFDVLSSPFLINKSSFMLKVVLFGSSNLNRKLTPPNLVSNSLHSAESGDLVTEVFQKRLPFNFVPYDASSSLQPFRTSKTIVHISFIFSKDKESALMYQNEWLSDAGNDRLQKQWPGSIFHDPEIAMVARYDTRLSKKQTDVGSSQDNWVDALVEEELALSTYSTTVRKKLRERMKRMIV